MNAAHVHQILFERYLGILGSAAPEGSVDLNFSNIHLSWMCRKALVNLDWPEDKLSRWLGFIQGVLAVKGLISVEQERDYSRPLFHAVYQQRQQAIPPTEHNRTTR